jgi:thiamine biosynthesis lipoprotein ApbE
MKTVLLAVLALACGDPPQAPLVSRAWPVLGTMMSAAAWGADTARLAGALAAARDSADQAAPTLRQSALFDSLRREVRQRTGMRLDTTQLAEGHALDRVASLLGGGIADSALLDIGGQYLWIGARETRRAVGIPDPDNSLGALGTVELRLGSVSTASDSGVTVTVLAPKGLVADAWSTSLGRLGCDSALALAPRISISVVCADSAGVRWTKDLEGRVQPARAP